MMIQTQYGWCDEMLSRKLLTVFSSMAHVLQPFIRSNMKISVVVDGAYVGNEHTPVAYRNEKHQSTQCTRECVEEDEGRARASIR